MLHTIRIDDIEILTKWFKWLAGHPNYDFKMSARKAFGDEMDTCKPKDERTYYIVCSDNKGLSLVRTTPPFSNNSIGISFSRIFDKTPEQRETEAHLWLKNALDEKIYPACREKGISLILIKPITCGGKRVCEELYKLPHNKNQNVVLYENGSVHIRLDYPS